MLGKFLCSVEWTRPFEMARAFQEMIFKRVLHPVGQGAFFTEQFYDESGKVVHNVVYDCGSFTSLPNLVEYEVMIFLLFANNIRERTNMLKLTHTFNIC